MPPQSRGSSIPPGFHSKSTPNLPTLRSLESNSSGTATQDSDIGRLTDGALSPTISEATSIEEFSLEGGAPQFSSGSSGSESESDDAPIGNLPSRRPIYHHHSRSHTYLGPSTFAPPFYNRPPTPLPPSPSLTSLLRPNFTQSSRPSTPDLSSDEGTSTRNGHLATGVTTGTQTPNSTSAAASTLTTSFRTARPIPRASPKVPTYEYYGFTLYLTSSLVFLLYLLWSFLPSPFLHQLGIYYYPNRWWALAIPAWLVMLICYIYVALASYNTGTLTLGMTELECLVDETGDIAVVDAEGKIVKRERRTDITGKSPGKKGGGASKGGKGHSRNSTADKIGVSAGTELNWRSLWNEGTDAVMDVPIGGVCEVLYGIGA